MKAVPAPLVVPLLAGAVLVGSALGPGVAAAFTSSRTVTTGALTAATVSAAYVNGTNDIGAVGGTGGSSYVMTTSGMSTLTPLHRYTTLTNNSSVAVTFASTITGTSTTGTMTVAVDRCSVAWAAGVCAGTTTALLAATPLSPAPSMSFGSVASSGVLYLRYTFTATSNGAGATITATATWSGVTRNRTAG